MRILFAILPIAVVCSIVDLDLVQVAGGLSEFKRYEVGPQADAVINLTQLDFTIYSQLANDIVPRARPAPDTSLRDYARECIRKSLRDLDPSMTVLKATIWCMAAMKNGSDPTLKIVLSDSAFADLSVLILNQFNSEIIVPSQPPPVIQQINWAEAILHLPPEFHAAEREKVWNNDLVKHDFWEARKNPPQLVHGPAPPPFSVAGNIYSLIASIPASRRLAIMNLIGRTRYRKNFHRDIGAVALPAKDKLYANYIANSIYIPQEVGFFLSGFIRRIPSSKYQNIRSASDIVAYFIRKDPGYIYLTPERVLEWYEMMTRGIYVFFERVRDYEFPENSNHLPRLNFCVDVWRKNLFTPRRKRLAETGIEIFWELER